MYLGVASLISLSGLTHILCIRLGTLFQISPALHQGIIPDACIVLFGAYIITEAYSFEKKKRQTIACCRKLKLEIYRLCRFHCFLVARQKGRKFKIQMQTIQILLLHTVVASKQDKKPILVHLNHTMISSATQFTIESEMNTIS